MRSLLQAQAVQWLVAPGAAVPAGDIAVIPEAMKMEHEVRAPVAVAARVKDCLHAAGAGVEGGSVPRRWRQ
jgi:biotin carboxyl carrier protein